MKMISANKLNRLWKNGVVAKMVAKTKVLKTIEEISANTNAENVAGAMAVKALSNNLTTQLPGSVRIISEGSGAAAKYYAQIGADAASKKPLGSGISDFNKLIRVCTAATGQTTAALLIDTWENELTKNNLTSKKYMSGSANLDMGVFAIDYGKTLGLHYTIRFKQTCLTSEGIYDEGRTVQWKYSENKNIYVIS